MSVLFEVSIKDLSQRKRNIIKLGHEKFMSIFIYVLAACNDSLFVEMRSYCLESMILVSLYLALRNVCNLIERKRLSW